MPKIWLDDVRRPPDESWIWVKSFEQARDCVLSCDKYDRVTVMSLDHDLGADGIAHLYSDEEKLFLRGMSEKTGLTFVKWFASNFHEFPPSIGENFIHTAFFVHSWNPDGGRDMVEALRDAGFEALYEPYGKQLLSFLRRF